MMDGETEVVYLKNVVDDVTIEKLLQLKWWDLPDEEVRDIMLQLIDGDIDAVLEKYWLSQTARKIVNKVKDAEQAKAGILPAFYYPSCF